MASGIGIGGIGRASAIGMPASGGGGRVTGALQTPELQARPVLHWAAVPQVVPQTLPLQA
jgi:hypothetical protein